ncbi:hypothetical protein THAR02_09643 [Trichoderma harzianum]|uniref:Uncharacterized protein n=1 Tax=Trichoderma harzianum TaxID=5544 RepID=A0A0F9ZCQ3_TRIHA|nr:hypothetical protein THAR02_09643 [Trichoderma harzianum]
MSTDTSLRRTLDWLWTPC